MAPATRLRSRRLRRLFILTGIVSTMTNVGLVLGQNSDSVPYGTQPVIISTAKDVLARVGEVDSIHVESPSDIPNAISLSPATGPATEQVETPRLPKSTTTKNPVLELATQSTASQLPASQLPDPQPSEPDSPASDQSSDESQAAMRGGVTVPVLMASEKTAKSTLELKPVAGPLFGRSRGRLFKGGLFRSPSTEEKEVDKSKVAQQNPAIPKPPPNVPNAPYVPHSRSATNRAPVPAQPRYSNQRNVAGNRPGQYQQNPVRSVQPQRNAPAPLRDTTPRLQPEPQYARAAKPQYARAAKPQNAREATPSPELVFRSPKRPTRLPSLESATKTPPDISIPSAALPIAALPSVELPSVELPSAELPSVEMPDVELPSLETPSLELNSAADLDTAQPLLNAPKKTQPILVSPTAPKQVRAPKQVPSLELQQSNRTPLAKAPVKKPEDSIGSLLRREKDEIGSLRQNTAKKKNASEPRLTRAAKKPSASVASRTRQENYGPRAQVIAPTPARPTLDYTGFPSTQVRVRPEVQRLRPIMQRTLQYFYDNPEIASGRSNWGMMHAIMVYGIDTRLRAGNRTYSTIAWIAGNNICRGQRLLTHDPSGIKVKSGVGLQGHQAQMLAIFSLCDVPADYPLYAGDMKYSMQHVIEAEKLACKSGEELTFTLIGLSHYLDTDSAWIAADGQRWDFQRLISEELSQPIVGTACGGTHRLMGFAHALRKRRHEGKPITGQWARAEQFVNDFISYTYSLQNRDGSMSTNWYEGRGDNGNLDRKIQTTGHMVELLLTVTPDSRLQDSRLYNAVRFLAVSMHNDLGREWKIGPKGHALRSLMMYHDRVFKSGSAWQVGTMALAPSRTIYR